MTDAIRYLARADVAEACREVDVVDAVREALRLHGTGETALPGEAYLPWTTAGGAAARSLAMPGYLGDGYNRPGTKVINASLANPAAGLPRASGVTLLFDPETARIDAILEAGHISALRTAAVTVVAARELGVQPVRTAAVVGAGELGRAHVHLLAGRLDGLESIAVFDLAPGRAERLCAGVARAAADRGVAVSPAGSARAAIDGAGLVVTATTVTGGYVPRAWLAAGAVVSHVSLDDLLPEVVLGAEHLIVDDWPLVRDDGRRLLGRLHALGRLVGPGETVNGGRARAVDGTLGEVVRGAYRKRRGPADVVVVNPFGMAIEDVMVAHRVHEVARRRGLGHPLPR
jgi:ornithine cyclodeaminase